MREYSVRFRLGETEAETESTQQEPAIEFLCDPALYGRIPPPQSAIRFAPDWFKRLEREMGGVDNHGLPALSAKACLPMTDAFSLGYIIPLPFDVEIMVPEGRVAIEISWDADAPFEPIDQHNPAQIGAPDAPFETTLPLKFINPWRIKVPPGYSVLFAQPLSRPDLPFTCFSGLVDCDRFDTTVNLPFAWTGPIGTHLLRAGTPIAQLVPIRRDTKLKRDIARPSTDAERAVEADARHRKYHEESTYARHWRVKK